MTVKLAPSYSIALFPINRNNPVQETAQDLSWNLQARSKEHLCLPGFKNVEQKIPVQETLIPGDI